ncbi:MAG TPA: histidine ammonia-lyase [Geminicoccaceae bacterium]|jgi:histidine ammonia-lyase|nr:histidine ammonia-lyase [Geminicoccaceae bacterium]
MGDDSNRRVTPGRLTLDELRAFAEGERRLELNESCWSAVEAAAAVVEKAALGGAPVYGINTGFGKLASVRIAPDQIDELQRRLVLSHMCGLGPPLPEAAVRLTLALKAASLALGHSGVRRRTVELLLALLRHDALPVIPAKGSVGASGDLAPLAHLAGSLIGVGEVRLDGAVITAATALARIGEQPLTLAAKEGLALLNGTQVSTALALLGLFRARAVFDAALVAGAMSVDAALGSDVPFEPRLNAVRGQPAQIRVAERLHAMLEGSAIRASHLVECERVQDPYSLRCQPQVMGACLELLDGAAAVLEREANGVSDNPLVFAEDGAILSGGNFHGEPVALAADQIALALAEVGSLAERRIALLTDPALSQLPAFLTPQPGLNSGFMLAQIAAAALASENQHLAHPAGIDSRPTSANQEDHVSMATYAARRLLEMTENAAHIVAIELLAAAQGIELRRPLESSAPLEAALASVRSHAAFLRDDRPLAGEIRAVADEILRGTFADSKA